MADHTISLEILIESANSAKTVEELKQSIVDLGKGIQKTKFGSDEFKQVQAKLVEQNKKLKEGFEASAKSTKAATLGLNEVGNAVGALSPKLGFAFKSFNDVKNIIPSLIKGFKGLKLAIASTGIGLLVVALGSLVSFFTKTQRGADIVSKAFAGIGATGDVLIDRVSALGEILVNAFKNPKQTLIGIGNAIKENITNRFEAIPKLLTAVGKGFKALAERDIEGLKDAANEASSALIQLNTGLDEQQRQEIGEAVRDLTNEIKEETKATVELEESSQKLRDREIDFIKTRAELRRDIEAQRLLAEDEALSNEQRADALRKAIQLQNQLTNEEIEIEKERARIIRERVELGESLSDDLEEQANAEARVIELESERDRRLRSVQTRLNAFTEGLKENTAEQEKNAEAQRKALEKLAVLQVQLEDERIKAIADREERERVQLETEFNRRIEAITGQSEVEIELRKQLELNKETALNEQAAQFQLARDEKAKVQAEKDKAEAEKNINDETELQFKRRQAILSVASSTASSLSAIGNLVIQNQKKNEAFQKTVAGVQIAIDTASAISAAIRTGSQIGITPLEKAVNIAGTIAVVLGNMAKAKKLLSSAGSSSAPSLDVPTSVSVGGGIGSQTQQQLPQIPQTLLLPPTDQTQIVVPVESINDVNQNVTEAKALSLIG